MAKKLTLEEKIRLCYGGDMSKPTDPERAWTELIAETRDEVADMLDDLEEIERGAEYVREMGDIDDWRALQSAIDAVVEVSERSLAKKIRKLVELAKKEGTP